MHVNIIFIYAVQYIDFRYFLGNVIYNCDFIPVIDCQQYLKSRPPLQQPEVC